MRKKAVVLLSGGLDSAVTLFYAKSKGYHCECLAVDYGQRHRKELNRSRIIARKAGFKLTVLKLPLPWKGSSLTDNTVKVPSGRSLNKIREGGIPNTYVPGRNTIFLSIASSFAEAIGASKIFIGAHSEDSSGYPDCGRKYLEIFRRIIGLGTKAGIDKILDLEFPLINKTKDEIISLGRKLKVPFESTWSCYKGGKRPCGVCDSCILRARGFEAAGLTDPGR